MHPAKPERAFCVSCGFPLRGLRCEICGSDQTPVHLAEGAVHDPRASVDDSAAQGLERAFDAHRSRDLARFVGHVITAEGGAGVRAFAMPEGPAWIAAIRGSLVFASINTLAAELNLQAPVVRVPRAQRVPVLRLALELGGQELATARFCLRDDLLVLRFGAPLASLAPLVLRDLLREIGHLAARWAELFAVSFDAHPALVEADRASVGFDVLGRARKLRLGGSGMMRSIPPPAPSVATMDNIVATIRPDSVKTAPLRAVPRSDPMARQDGERPSSPKGVAPLPISGFSAKAPLQPPPPSRPAPQVPSPVPMAKAELPEPVFELAASSVRPRPLSEPIPAILAPMFVGGASGKSGLPVIPPLPPLPSGLSSPRMRQPMPELELEAPSRQPSMTTAAASQEMREPADRLCGLLRQAKALASLVLENRPATMPWLVRATVFRAIHEHRAELPEAVAHLYRCTGTGRDAPEPALLVLDRVINARARHPGEKPLAIDPLTSAALAKEHIGRYVAEIERSPLDVTLRHFLAVGALSELLARAKLPSQTEFRLRDIVGHAQREGAKQGPIDLMMMALQRIAGG